MIELNGKTKLIGEYEKTFIAVGGANPSKTFSRTELSNAIVNTLDVMAEHNPQLLEKIYQRVAKNNPDLPSLEELKRDK